MNICLALVVAKIYNKPLAIIHKPSFLFLIAYRQATTSHALISNLSNTSKHRSFYSPPSNITNSLMNYIIILPMPNWWSENSKEIPDFPSFYKSNRQKSVSTKPYWWIRIVIRPSITWLISVYTKSNTKRPSNNTKNAYI